MRIFRKGNFNLTSFNKYGEQEGTTLETNWSHDLYCSQSAIGRVANLKWRTSIDFTDPKITHSMTSNMGEEEDEREEGGGRRRMRGRKVGRRRRRRRMGGGDDDRSVRKSSVSNR